MSIHVEIVGARELKAKFDKIAQGARRNIRGAVAWAQYRVTYSIQGLLSGVLLRNRTGNLERSITPGPIEDSGDRISGIVGTKQIYARIQNDGGTITAKSGALTIPMEAALTGAGVPRFSARDVLANPGVGGFERAWVARDMVLASSGRTVVTLFLLRRSVTLRGQHYMEAGLDKERGAIEQRFAQALAAAVGA